MDDVHGFHAKVWHVSTEANVVSRFAMLAAKDKVDLVSTAPGKAAEFSTKAADVVTKIALLGSRPRRLTSGRLVSTTAEFKA